MTNYLRDAIMAAGEELGSAHQWLFEEGGDTPEPNGCFVSVLEKHLAPLLDPDVKKRRIAVLEAELAVLKESQWRE
jgi:hypothetical protein